MKNFIESGHKYTITASADIVSGAPVVVGDRVLVAAGAIANGSKGILDACGVFKLKKKATLALSQGVTVYWDATNGEVTDLAASGANKKIGYVHLAALAADATVNVELHA